MKGGRPRADDGIPDPVLVDRLVTGRGYAGRVSAADGHEAVRRLHALGMTDGQIGCCTGYTRRNVTRIRVLLGLAAVLAADGSNQLDWLVDAPTLPRRPRASVIH